MQYCTQYSLIPPCLAEGLEWPVKRMAMHCTVRSALKRSPVQDVNSFSILFCQIISTTYQKIGDLFYTVHISGLSHSMKNIIKFDYPSKTVTPLVKEMLQATLVHKLHHKVWTSSLQAKSLYICRGSRDKAKFQKHCSPILAFSYKSSYGLSAKTADSCMISAPMYPTVYFLPILMRFQLLTCDVKFFAWCTLLKREGPPTRKGSKK